MKRLTIPRSLAGAFALGLLLTFTMAGVAGCEDDNPVVGDGDHFEPVGLVLRIDGTEIVRYQNGAVSGAIDVAEGGATSQVEVRFIMEDGGLAVPEDDDEQLGVEIDDATIADVVDDDSGDWKFRIRGIAAGETDAVVRILHGGHADFQSKQIPVRVTR